MPAAWSMCPWVSSTWFMGITWSGALPISKQKKNVEARYGHDGLFSGYRIADNLQVIYFNARQVVACHQVGPIRNTAK